MSRVIVGICAGLLVACGPRIEEDPDPDWMLGTFSNVSDPSRTGRGDYSKLKLNEDGTGLYTRLGCEGDDNEGAVVWELEGNDVRVTAPHGEHFLRHTSSGSPFLLTLERLRHCDASSAVEAHAARTFRFLEEPDARIDTLFYRTDPCSGPYPQQPPCPDDGSECDGPLPCRVEWCEGFEPEPCE